MMTTVQKERPRQSSGQRSAPATKLRTDIQGLRAIAVIAVISDHLFGWPLGGFVGVDIFFVISGFLITGLLLREHDRTGTIAFVDFYKRRIRRILPAATLVLVVTSLVSYVVFNSGRASQTVADAIWAFFFSANWHFAAIGTDYFQSAGPVSPVQHYWSLAVEEQFYFVWPWLMVLIFLIGRKTAGWNTVVARRAVGVAMAFIVLSSFLWAMWDSSASPTWAYFSTFSRAWELGAGALLAVVATRMHSLPRILRPILGWVGIAGITVSLFVVNESQGFPAPWGALPVLSTVLVVLAGTGGEPRYLYLLSNPVSQYVGRISYSLYLWHFPVIILLGSVLKPGVATFAFLALACMFALAALAYHLVEEPLLKSTWLRNVSAAERQARVWKKRQKIARVQHRAPGYIGLGALLVVSSFLVTIALIPQTAPPSSIVVQDVDENTPTVLAASETLAADVEEALTSDSWPEFDPPIENLIDQRVPQWTSNDCLNVSDENVDLCVYGASNPSGVVAILGDSIATSWLPGVIGAVEPHGFAVHSFTMEGCPFAFAEVRANGAATTAYEACSEHQAWVTAQVAELQPDVIIISDSALSLRRLVSAAEDSAAEAEWTTAYSAGLAALPQDTTVISLLTPPGGANLQSCYTPISSPSDCVEPMSEAWETLKGAEQSAAASAGVAFIDTGAWFCSRNACPSFINTAAVYADTGHLTAAMSERLAPVIAEALVAAGALPSAS
jgi:peptidoglycan/LPS O-acetylase OafA/YrhL